MRKLGKCRIYRQRIMQEGSQTKLGMMHVFVLACVRACACISLFICVCICLYSCVYIAVNASIHSCVRMTLHKLKTPRRAKAGAVARKEKVSQVQLARPAWHPGD